jgi:hypothetical protein
MIGCKCHAFAHSSKIRGVKQKGKRKNIPLLPLVLVDKLFRRFFRLGRFLGLFAFVPVVLTLELLHPARGIDEFHFAGEERMTCGTDFDRNVFARAARGELVATPAGDGGFFIFWMNVFFHDRYPVVGQLDGVCGNSAVRHKNYRKIFVLGNRDWMLVSNFSQTLTCPSPMSL